MKLLFTESLNVLTPVWFRGSKRGEIREVCQVFWSPNVLTIAFIEFDLAYPTFEQVKSLRRIFFITDYT